MVWRRVFGQNRQQQEVLTPVEARQGFLDKPVLLVLMISMALVIAIFGVMLFA